MMGTYLKFYWSYMQYYSATKDTLGNLFLSTPARRYVAHDANGSWGDDVTKNQRRPLPF